MPKNELPESIFVNSNKQVRTWALSCPGDIQYVRADLYDKLKAEIESMRDVASMKTELAHSRKELSRLQKYEPVRFEPGY